jgi:hypothetical protein
MFLARSAAGQHTWLRGVGGRGQGSRGRGGEVMKADHASYEWVQGSGVGLERQVPCNLGKQPLPGPGGCAFPAAAFSGHATPYSHLCVRNPGFAERWMLLQQLFKSLPSLIIFLLSAQLQGMPVSSRQQHATDAETTTPRCREHIRRYKEGMYGEHRQQKLAVLRKHPN